MDHGPPARICAYALLAFESLHSVGEQAAEMPSTRPRAASREPEQPQQSSPSSHSSPAARRDTDDTDEWWPTECASPDRMGSSSGGRQAGRLKHWCSCSE